MELILQKSSILDVWLDSEYTCDAMVPLTTVVCIAVTTLELINYIKAEIYVECK